VHHGISFVLSLFFVSIKSICFTQYPVQKYEFFNKPKNAGVTKSSRGRKSKKIPQPSRNRSSSPIDADLCNHHPRYNEHALPQTNSLPKNIFADKNKLLEQFTAILSQPENASMRGFFALGKAHDISPNGLFDSNSGYDYHCSASVAEPLDFGYVVAPLDFGYEDAQSLSDQPTNSDRFMFSNGLLNVDDLDFGPFAWVVGPVEPVTVSPNDVINGASQDHV